jgi:hypothetical protein
VPGGTTVASGSNEKPQADVTWGRAGGGSGRLDGPVDVDGRVGPEWLIAVIGALPL